LRELIPRQKPYSENTSMQQQESAVMEVPARRVDMTGALNLVETVAIEGPLELRLNGEPLTVTMRTPGADRLLARGLLHTEGILARAADVVWRGGETGGAHDVVVLDARVDPASILRDPRLDRTLVATTSCGLCGRTQFRPDELSEGCPLELPRGRPIPPTDFPAMMRAMRDAQSTFEACGGVHAAALFHRNGSILQLHEDVGRHNAVDKVVGWLIGVEGASADVLAVSGRVSYEIVIKCWRAGIPNIIAVSAPTSLAVATAKRLGVTLAGFCREDRATIYT
jgi:FdhD protein